MEANGNNYPPDSLYSLCCGIQRKLYCDEKSDISNVNIFTNSKFKKFTQILDAQMKQLQLTGMFQKRSADTISEDKLWEVGVLGDSKPQALYFYYVGLYFALQGGDEHTLLSSGNLKFSCRLTAGSLPRVHMVYTRKQP